MIDFDIKEPIDIKVAVEKLRGNKTLYFQILSKFEQISVNKNMETLANYVDKGDWEGMNMMCHMLKISSGTVGAGKMHYACFYI